MKSELVVRGEHDEKTVQQMWGCMGVGDVRGGVLCADGHFGYSQPVGGVVALRGQVSVSGVGFDIGCGNAAARLSMKGEYLLPRLDEISQKIGKRIDFGVGGKRSRSQGWVDDPLFDSHLWKDADVEHLKDLAVSQLGTVGSGNHYVDLFVDEEDHVWIGVHFGSRGLGHKTATKYLQALGYKEDMMAAPAIADVYSEIGQRYLAGMHLAGQYAYAGRNWVIKEVRGIIGSEQIDYVHNHHNFAWSEEHFGDEDLWVVRKGATPAFPGQRGFVGGSMGDRAVILEGVDSEASRANLYSTVHGAGRVMGRMQAKGKRDKKTGEWRREPGISREDWIKWIDDFGVKVVGGDVDESPQAYRRLDDVLRHHEGTVKVNHVLRPVLVHMAGNDVRDPYKD
jgi:tRNA-splicing ligase RtcB